MRRHIGTALILLGIVVIAFPFIGRYVANKKQEEMLEAFYLEAGNIMDDSSETLEELDDIFEETNTVEGQEALDEALEDIGNIALDGGSAADFEDAGLGNSATLTQEINVVGTLSIEKIGIDETAIASGADLDILKYSIGHMESTAPLGSIGNSAIAGHRSHSFGVYFNRLDELEIGDEIIVKTFSEVITYVVYETLIVEPDDVSVLRNSSKYRVLTLVTCDPVYNPTHRLIIHAIDKSQME